MSQRVIRPFIFSVVFGLLVCPASAAPSDRFTRVSSERLPRGKWSQRSGKGWLAIRKNRGPWTKTTVLTAEGSEPAAISVGRRLFWKQTRITGKDGTQITVWGKEVNVKKPAEVSRRLFLNPTHARVLPKLVEQAVEAEHPELMQRLVSVAIDALRTAHPEQLGEPLVKTVVDDSGASVGEGPITIYEFGLEPTETPRAVAPPSGFTESDGLRLSDDVTRPTLKLRPDRVELLLRPQTRQSKTGTFEHSSWGTISAERVPGGGALVSASSSRGSFAMAITPQGYSAETYLLSTEKMLLLLHRWRVNGELSVYDVSATAPWSSKLPDGTPFTITKQGDLLSMTVEFKGSAENELNDRLTDVLVEGP